MRALILALLLCLAAPSFAEESAEDSTAIPQVTTVAYYFYTTARCASCLKIERLSHEAIEQGFADQIANGELTWMMKNLDEAENEHFVEDYNLFTKTLVLAQFQDGKQTKWQSCPKVWELLNDEDEFKRYVAAEVTAFLGQTDE